MQQAWQQQNGRSGGSSLLVSMGLQGLENLGALCLPLRQGTFVCVLASDRHIYNCVLPIAAGEGRCHCLEAQRFQNRSAGPLVGCSALPPFVITPTNEAYLVRLCLPLPQLSVLCSVAQPGLSLGNAVRARSQNSACCSLCVPQNGPSLHNAVQTGYRLPQPTHSRICRHSVRFLAANSAPSGMSPQ